MSVFESDDINVIRVQIREMRDADQTFQLSLFEYLEELRAEADEDGTSDEVQQKILG